MVAPLTVSVFYDKSISTRSAIANRIETIMRQTYSDISMMKWRHVDPREGYLHSDVNIHLDWPVLEAMGWAFVNICVRNPDKWNDVWEKNTTRPEVDCVVNIEDFDTFANISGGIQTALHRVFDRRPVRGVVHCPPILQVDDCPPISIITPTFNRKNMIDIAFHNILSTDYPADKIEWIVIEDAKRSEDMASDKIVNFQINCPTVKLKYVPIQGRMTIGEKRNIGIEHATADIILFMDDDDHYPPTSFRRRVAWLLHGRSSPQVVACTSIALYDLKRGVSAVNVPPFHLPVAQRISEATLTFKKSFWESRKFTDVSIAEGEEWLNDRENDLLIIPPQQIIVAFTHDNNASHRRIPPVDAGVGCFWGFPKEYLVFIHRLAGVEIEEDTSDPGSKDLKRGQKKK